MLIAALIRLSLDVQVNPAGARIAVRGSESAERGLLRQPGRLRDFLQCDALDPCLTCERASPGHAEHDPVTGPRGGEAQAHAGPRPRAAEGFRMHVERRSEEHTSELQSPYVLSYAVLCLQNNSCV